MHLKKCKKHKDTYCPKFGCDQCKADDNRYLKVEAAEGRAKREGSAELSDTGSTASRTKNRWSMGTRERVRTEMDEIHRKLQEKQQADNEEEADGSEESDVEEEGVVDGQSDTSQGVEAEQNDENQHDQAEEATGEMGKAEDKAMEDN